jgi:hypothetical protein
LLVVLSNNILRALSYKKNHKCRVKNSLKKRRFSDGSR